MKIRSMCFSNRREAWFNPSSIRPISRPHNSSDRLDRIPRRRSFHFSAAHNCCIVFSSSPLHPVTFLSLYINHIYVALSSGFCLFMLFCGKCRALPFPAWRLCSKDADMVKEWGIINWLCWSHVVELVLVNVQQICPWGFSAGCHLLGRHLVFCHLQKKNIWFYTFFI